MDENCVSTPQKQVDGAGQLSESDAESGDKKEVSTIPCRKNRKSRNGTTFRCSLWVALLYYWLFILHREDCFVCRKRFR